MITWTTGNAAHHIDMPVYGKVAEGTDVVMVLSCTLWKATHCINHPTCSGLIPHNIAYILNMLVGTYSELKLLLLKLPKDPQLSSDALSLFYSDQLCRCFWPSSSADSLTLWFPTQWIHFTDKMASALKLLAIYIILYYISFYKQAFPRGWLFEYFPLQLPEGCVSKTTVSPYTTQCPVQWIQLYVTQHMKIWCSGQTSTKLFMHKIFNNPIWTQSKGIKASQ